MKHTIGILGDGTCGNGGYVGKFVELRHASCDQQHIPLIVSSIPDIPDRTACLLSGGPSPYRYLERYLHMLEDAGAECIVIPCNTAHYWFDDLQNVAKARMISISGRHLGIFAIGAARWSAGDQCDAGNRVISKKRWRGG